MIKRVLKSIGARSGSKKKKSVNRTFEEDKLGQLIDWVEKEGNNTPKVKETPGREAKFTDIDADPRLLSALETRGIKQVYSHQGIAYEYGSAGKDFVIATPTASGKTFCYNLPVVDAILKDPDAKALYLFPIKALAQDQLSEFRELSDQTGTTINAYVYDGDTPKDVRRKAREDGSVIITNPDMLNAGILPGHAYWRKYFQNLRYIVIDELHTYKGIFGSHVANVFARLNRICEYYGSRPVYICCSATIANPKEHAEALTGHKMELITENGAAASEKKVMIYNPLAAATAQKRGQMACFDDTIKISAKAICMGISTIIFARKRMEVELILKSIRDRIQELGGDPNTVMSYRGGYLPAERRKIEKDLRSGALKGVVSTNALEVGIDIGSLELVVLNGFPGSIASTWQRIGRAGRRKGGAASILVVSGAPLDQYLYSRPSWLFSAPSEYAFLDPLNPFILKNHLKCAANELPLNGGIPYINADVSKVLDELYMEGELGRKERKTLSGESTFVYRYEGDDYPSSTFSLRKAVSDEYSVLDAKGKEIAVVDGMAARLSLLPSMIYLHAGSPFEVDSLDNKNKICRVKETDAAYYTPPDIIRNIIPRENYERKGDFGWGRITVVSRVVSYTRRDINTQKQMEDAISVDAKPEYLDTTGFWFKAGKHFASEGGVPSGDYAAEISIEGLKYLLHQSAQACLMCDRSDILLESGVSIENSPAIFVADSIPGGAGLAEGAYHSGEHLFSLALSMVESCQCERGCPGCVGRSDDAVNIKEHVCRMLNSIISELKQQRDNETPTITKNCDVFSH